LSPPLVGRLTLIELPAESCFRHWCKGRELTKVMIVKHPRIDGSLYKAPINQSSTPKTKPALAIARAMEASGSGNR